MSATKQSNFCTWVFFKLPRSLSCQYASLSPHAGLRTISTMGKRGNRGNWILVAYRDGPLWQQKEAWERDFHKVWLAAVQQGWGALPKQGTSGCWSLVLAELVFTPVSSRVSVGGVSTIG